MGIMSHESEFIKDLMKVLGIDPGRTRAFSIFARVDEFVTIEVEQYADDTGAQTEIKRYKLTKEEIEG
jgi:hypothetical protein